MAELDAISNHVVVDGSNLATEGRSLPSFAQLNSALADFKSEFPKVKLTIVVDATFEHRIDKSEAKAYEAAEAKGQILTPPAGAIGRGDAFVLRIADKIGATVLSNDSFQEFHGEYEWLFTEGRLLGGKPVPGIGWIFTLRTPVRGPKSRVAVAQAKKNARKKEALSAGFTTLEEEVAARRARATTKASGSSTSSRGSKSSTSAAAAKATKSAAKPAASSVRASKASDDVEVDARTGAKRRRRRHRHASDVAVLQPVNDASAFLQFVAKHRVKSKVQGLVESFASHGCYIMVNDARCYVPLVNLASPPPRSARDLVRKGAEMTFEVVGFQAARRSIELATPGAMAEAARVRLSAASSPDEVKPSGRPAKKGAAKAVATKAPSKVAAKPARKEAAAKTAKKSAPTVAKKSAKKAAPTVAKKSAKKAAPAKAIAVKKATSPVAKKSAAKPVAKKSAAKPVASKSVAPKSVAPKSTAKKVVKVAAKATSPKAVAKKAPSKVAKAAKKSAR